MTHNASHAGAVPFFLSGVAGKLFALYFPPANEQAPKRAALYFPPFAEEMNKARRMAMLQARKFADLGHAVLLIDLFGTGDSEGDFAVARWATWHGDLTLAAEWLLENGAERLVFWGLRLGALLAVDVAASNVRSQIDRLVLWQPVTRGELFMTQFLRLRLAADMTSKSDRLTTQQLRENLKRGVPLEVAGYTLAPEMLTAVDNLKMETMTDANLPVIDWIEIMADDKRPMSAASQRLLEIWRTAGMGVRTRAVIGEPFWATPEITLAPALVEKTSELLGGHARNEP